MSTILLIETATDVCSVGIARDGELISLCESAEGRDHASRVAVYVDQMLREHSLQPEDLDAVAVSKGPGSYTGLRIGVSFAKGLCYALGKPLIGVSTLASMAQIAIEEHKAGIISVENWESATLCPMIDARRMEVYTQLLNINGGCISDIEAKIIDEESFSKELSCGCPFLIFGNGAQKCLPMLKGATMIDVTPSARGMVRLAQQALESSDTENVAYFEPLYLKDFVVTTTQKKYF